MKRPEILAAAKACVCGKRDEQYGAPEDSFEAISSLWDDYLTTVTKGRNGLFFITAHDVGIMMALLKIARIATGQVHADNYVDGCGYLACAAEIATNGKGVSD